MVLVGFFAQLRQDRVAKLGLIVGPVTMVFFMYLLSWSKPLFLDWLNLVSMLVVAMGMDLCFRYHIYRKQRKLLAPLEASIHRAVKELPSAGGSAYR